MSSRTTGREIRVGLVVVAAIGGLLGLFSLAGGGPGFLSARRQIDVDFRDGQGIRPGGQVRIAGIDSGRVVAVTLAEVEGILKARVRLAIPADLASRLRADAKITIQSSLTGQSRINILSAGKAGEPLKPGKVLLGVETSMFDPILDQVGLGPVERSHLSHTIGEVREMVDSVGPQVKLIVEAARETASGIRDTSENVRPVVEATVGNVGEAARRIAAASPRVELALAQVTTLTTQVNGLLGENRPNIAATIASLRDLSATLKMVVARDQEKVASLLDHIDGTRNRADLALYNVKQITDVAISMLAKNRVDVERTVANVKDATDWGSKLVQKIYANPFVLSPLYKPTPEDVRVQSVYDSAQVFAAAATKLDDAARTLAVLQAKPNSPEQAEGIETVRRQVAEVTGKLGQMSTQLTEAMRPQAGRGAGRRAN